MFPKPIFLGVVAVFYCAVAPGIYAADQKFCNDIKKLIESSHSQFSAIRGESLDSSGSYQTSFTLPEASSCVILSDIEKTSYQCSWEFPYNDKQAKNRYNHFQKEIKNCMGGDATESKDQLVNHPDLYLSYSYQLSDVQTHVSLKNKSQQTKTYVSIRIDGFKIKE